MNWIILAALAPLMFAIYQILTKLLPDGVSLFLVNAYASLCGALVMFFIHFIASEDKAFHLTPSNLALTVGIGVFIAFGNFFIMKAFALGAPQSSFSAIMYPLLIMYSLIAGVLLWQEKINIWQLLGIVLAIAGIILVFYFKDNPAPNQILQ